MKQPITYADSGVDIDAGDELVRRIKPLAKATMRPEVSAGIGGFCALVDLPFNRYKSPVLASSTDGVGTKLRLAMDCQQFEGVGIDLVAMCVNDLVVCGAEPLFFLDYYATGKLEVDTAATVIGSIAKGCIEAGCALVGGETAEMPSFYQDGDFDLAGFSVGLVEKADIVTGKTIQSGDVLLGLSSSGFHANGFSLVRKILSTRNIPLTSQVAGVPLSTLLLAPTRIYVKAVLALHRAGLLLGAAHITGGGLLENIPRCLPDNLQATLDARSWPIAPVFHWAKEEAGLDWTNMFRTFNCGIGMQSGTGNASGSA
ncbi:MAG: phosphoribosylformylglycinamidine cyclo-ligase, partial [Pseudomonadota bacterium]